jgi:hypothetical protein
VDREATIVQSANQHRLDPGSQTLRKCLQLARGNDDRKKRRAGDSEDEVAVTIRSTVTYQSPSAVVEAGGGGFDAHSAVFA